METNEMKTNKMEHMHSPRLSFKQPYTTPTPTLDITVVLVPDPTRGRRRAECTLTAHGATFELRARRSPRRPTKCLVVPQHATQGVVDARGVLLRNPTVSVVVAGGRRSRAGFRVQLYLGQVHVPQSGACVYLSYVRPRMNGDAATRCKACGSALTQVVMCGGCGHRRCKECSAAAPGIFPGGAWTVMVLAKKDGLVVDDLVVDDLVVDKTATGAALVARARTCLRARSELTGGDAELVKDLARVLTFARNTSTFKNVV